MVLGLGAPGSEGVCLRVEASAGVPLAAFSEAPLGYASFQTKSALKKDTISCLRDCDNYSCQGQSCTQQAFLFL